MGRVQKDRDRFFSVSKNRLKAYWGPVTVESSVHFAKLKSCRFHR